MRSRSSSQALTQERVHLPEHNVNKGPPFDRLEITDQPILGLQARDGNHAHHHKRGNDEEGHEHRHLAHNRESPARISSVSQQDVLGPDRSPLPDSKMQF
jgi:hypothetical protein